MQKELRNLLKLLSALVIVIFFFTVIRIYFYFINPEFFSNLDNWLPAFMYGLFYDTVFVLIINGLVFFLFFLPFRIRNTAFWQGITKICFVSINFSVLLFYLLTAKFYENISGIFIKISENKKIFQTLNTQFATLNFSLSNTWDVLLIAIFILMVLWNTFPSINNMLFEKSKSNTLTKKTLSMLGAVLLLSGLYYHIYRSDYWQIKLFSKLNRTEQVLSFNTSYKLLYFYLHKNENIPLNKNNTQIGNLFSTQKKYFNNRRIKQNLILVNINNVTISDTVFKQILDASGMSYHLKDNFYTTHKLEGLQLDELFMSFPAFMEKPLMQTIFAFNQYNSFADILRKNNYKNFWVSSKTIAKSAKNFYGFDVLIADKDLDKSLLKLSETIPPIDRNYFIFINLEADFEGLMNFLTTEYVNNNTLIIINLKAITKNDFAYGKTAFLLPENASKHRFTCNMISDLDIFPSLIDYLGINDEITAFGLSIFKKHDKCLFQYTGDDFIVLNDSLLLRYNGISTKWMINYRTDPDEYIDLQDIYPVQKIKLENKIRAVISEYLQKLKQH